MTDENNQGAQSSPAQQFAIQKVYMKDMSFETPNSPTIFTTEWKPDINLQLTSNATPLNEGVFEVVLSVTVTAKLADKTAYLAEVQQAGIFTVSGFEEQQQAPMLGAFCPNVLYPFAREAVADLIGKGGFPPVYLAPVNFDALFAQKAQEIQAQVASGNQGGNAH
jgi:preprotein translocase subunit SecB